MYMHTQSYSDVNGQYKKHALVLYIYIYMYIYICGTDTYIHTYIHTDRQTDRQTDIHTYIHSMYTHTHIIYIYIYMYVCMYIYIYAYVTFRRYTNHVKNKTQFFVHMVLTRGFREASRGAGPVDPAAPKRSRCPAAPCSRRSTSPAPLRATWALWVMGLGFRVCVMGLGFRLWGTGLGFRALSYRLHSAFVV